ncbi:hypothetical protein [Vaginisenegalia massiliensis]|uniref:hypothetical protein n=1 Tax=Vaginisenegalia massiliensis TaxID=2058294 RepID=UPI000F547890|nr:hypothetical protein [Vaginisenegalia massiliensis]
MCQSQPQYLNLTPNEDNKKWVCEIVGEDPVFRFKRAFLPEMAEGQFAIYDGVYQIHGIYPGISPFNKEYCLVRDGHMQRHLTFSMVQECLPAILANQESIKERVKFQIKQQLAGIEEAVDHELVKEALEHQIDQLDDLTEISQLYACLAQLIKQKDSLIRQFQKQVEYYRRYHEEF